MSGVILTLEGVEKRYGDARAVRDVELAVREGEFLTLLGPSGSGKSTLLRMVAGFIVPDRGRILLDGRDVSFMAPGQRRLGMVFQNYALFPHLSAADNIAYPLKLRRWARERRDARVGEMLSLVGLSTLGRRYPRELSGGQQQRVALARAIAFDPRMLLMDEPLGALDQELRVRMAAELRRLHRDLATTFLYVTHDRDEAMSLSDRIAIMREGLLEAVGPPAQLYTRPPTEFVATFLGGHNVVGVEAAESVGEGIVRVCWAGQSFDIALGEGVDPRGLIGMAIPRTALSPVPLSPDPIMIEATVGERTYLGEALEFTLTSPSIGTLTGRANADIMSAGPGPGRLQCFYLHTAKCVAVARHS